MRIVIVGAGDIGLELAENLVRREKNELVIIDADEKRCEEISNRLDALVLHGDGTDPEILKKAQMAEAEALIAATGTDAINTVIAMLGHRFEVQKIIVTLKDMKLRSACEEIGVSRIITPKISAVAEILSVLDGIGRVNFSVMERGNVRLAELEVGKLEGAQLSAVEMPDGAYLVAVLRDEQILIPRQKLKLEDEDDLIVLIESDEVLEKVKKTLKTGL